MKTGSLRYLMLLVVVLVGACRLASARMHLPDELAVGGERYEVEGGTGIFRRNVEFGPYRTRGASVGAARGSPSITTLWGRFKSADATQASHQEARFTLLAPGEARYQGTCRRDKNTVVRHDKQFAWDRERRFHVDDEAQVVRSGDTFHCTLSRPSAPALHLTVVGGLYGVVRGEGVEITIKPSSEQDDQPFPSASALAGFLLAEAGQPVAAVDLTARHAVTLPRSGRREQRDALAVVCMSLLMLQRME